MAQDPQRPPELTVVGTLAGDAGVDVWLLARHRGDQGQVRCPATAGAGQFRAVLDLRQLVPTSGGPQVWDLYLVPAPGAAPRRIAAPEPEMANRHRVMRYPTRVVVTGQTSWRLGPYVTLDGALAVSATPVEAVSPGPNPGTAGLRHGGGRSALRRRLPQPLRPVLVRARNGLRRSVSGAATLTILAVLRGLADRSAARTAVAASAGQRSRVYLLIQHAYGMGGTIRATLNLAGVLSRDYDVEIVSVLRHRAEPFFGFPAGVRVTALTDRTQPDPPAGGWWEALRRLGRRYLQRSASRLVHAEDFAYPACSLETDLALLRWLRSLPPALLITTRPASNLIAARYAPRGVITVGQEHQHFAAHRPGLAAAIAAHYPKLDALAVLSAADEADYRRLLGSRTVVRRIPNVLPEPPPVAAGPRRKVVLAAGRLTRQKGFDRLIEAFAAVAEAEPAWTLRIYGGGPQAGALRSLIFQRELYNSVYLMGPTDRLGEEMGTSSLFALSSRYEGFGMVIVEAMNAGLAVVSFDCPNGPAEILSDRVDGLLVPNGDVAAFGDALLDLIRDEVKRNRLAAAGRRTVTRYRPETIGRQWRDLLVTLGARPAG